MKTTRIYQPGSFKVSDTITLSKEACQHIFVLKLNVDDVIILFNDTGIEYHSKITELNKRLIQVTIFNKVVISRESPLSLELGACVSKEKRMEWVVQKAVELGVNVISPIISERVVVKLDAERWGKKWQQWQNIAISACEQCGRNVIPSIQKPITFNAFIEQKKRAYCLIMSPSSVNSCKQLPSALNDICLLIGPEGGFSEVEINLAKQHNFKDIVLGPRVLRTESAAIAAISVLQAMYGDL